MKEVTTFTYSSDEFEEFSERLKELFNNKCYVPVNSFPCSNRVVLVFKSSIFNETADEHIFVEYVSP